MRVLRVVLWRFRNLELKFRKKRDDGPTTFRFASFSLQRTCPRFFPTRSAPPPPLGMGGRAGRSAFCSTGHQAPRARLRRPPRGAGPRPLCGACPSHGHGASRQHRCLSRRHRHRHARYTDSITSQVTGVITAVHYREGQTVKQGDPLIDIDPRPFQAPLEQAQGALERDQNLLAEAQMDVDRYKVAWSKNAIPRQTLEDQEKARSAGSGHGQERPGHRRLRQGPARLLPHHLAHRGPLGPAPGRSRQPGHGQLHHHPGRGRAGPAHHGCLHLAEDSLPEVMQQIARRQDPQSRGRRSHPTPISWPPVS